MSTDATGDLAAAVRELAALVHGRTLDEASAARARRLVAEAAELVAACPPRPRWHEGPDRRARSAALSPFSGSLNVVAPPLTLDRVTLDDATPAIEGRVRLDRLREGPPHSVHGGVLAGLFDEVCGAAQRLTGRPGGVTARLLVRYRRPTPLDTDLRLVAWVADERTRRVHVRGRCEAGGVVTAEAEAVFVRVNTWPASGEAVGGGTATAT